MMPPLSPYLIVSVVVGVFTSLTLLTSPTSSTKPRTTSNANTGSATEPQQPPHTTAPHTAP